MKKVSQLLLVGLLLLVFAAPSLAWGGRPPARKAGLEKAWPGIAKKLELTPDQQKKFKAHNEEMKKLMEQHQKEMKGIAEQLKVEMKKEPPDRQKINGLVRRMGELRTRMEVRRMDSLLEMRQQLTPEQREKFKKMLDNRKERGARPQKPGGKPNKR